jgi:hypothetical protein
VSAGSLLFRIITGCNNSYHLNWAHHHRTCAEPLYVTLRCFQLGAVTQRLSFGVIVLLVWDFAYVSSSQYSVHEL